jgi:hypothetical protein
MDAREVTEYAGDNQDREWATRISHPGELYLADQWARDQRALGTRVLRRRVIVIDDWAEMRPNENT